MLEPVWSCGAALPNSLVDLLDTGESEEEEEEEDEKRKNKFDFDDFSESDGDDLHLSYEFRGRLTRGS